MILLLGYEITIAVYASFLLMLAFIFLERKDVGRLLGAHIDRYSLAVLAAIVAFFLIFSLLYVSPVEQLYFDENIYQGIAMNILSNGNALWCQFGTAYAKTCYINALYHDPVGWTAFIAVAFAIFGIGIKTAYGLELLCGALSIIFVFLLASVLWKRKGFAVLAALGMAVMPQLFIWARTQADIDLPFMMLAALTFLLFVLFVKRKNIYSLGAFAFCLVLTSYMRIEAMIFVLLFAVLLVFFSDSGLLETARERIGTIRKTIETDTRALLVLLAFVVLLLPQVYYIALEAQNPAYGQSSSQSILSLTNFRENIVTNVKFLFGLINGISFYPTAFHYTVFPLALLGIIALVLNKKIKNRFGIIALSGLWFLAYFLFYTSFYAGAATYGVDSRFMLQLLPPLCLLAAFALLGIADAVSFLVSKGLRRRREGKPWPAVFYSSLAVSSIFLLIFPFALLAPNITLSPKQMPQQTVILPAINSFYANYSVVPNNCLVFSFTPDIWLEANRSSAQIGYLLGSNQSIKNEISRYSCLVADYGYWCVVPPYHASTCSYVVSRFKTTNLLPSTASNNGSAITFYRILNYT